MRPRTILGLSALCLLLGIASSWQLSVSQEEGPGKKKGNSVARQLPSTAPFAQLNRPGYHEDFPAMCLNEEGKP
ncbi:MAG: hypothetical protein AAF491_06510, partial [Verrucomicrobiota bacterium]